MKKHFKCLSLFEFQGMGISSDEYMHVVDDILQVLDEQKIDSVSKNEVLAILWSLKGMIIGQ